MASGSAVVLRSSEWLLVLYFVIAAVRAAARGFFMVGALDACVPVVLIAIELMQRAQYRTWIEIARDWIPLSLLLAAYRNVDSIATPRSSYAFEFRWIGLDRLLLNHWHGRALIEHFGSVFPAVLEFSYLTLYAVPPLLLAAVYLLGGRRHADRFLFTLLAGTLLTYTLLPLFPSESPRFIFPGQDLPAFMTMFRRANFWLLDACDIHASIFPSGHVTVAFSSAFAAMAVLPERRWLNRLLFVFATLVFINTVYGRYHFAVDGAAGFAISVLGYRVSRAAVTSSDPLPRTHPAPQS